MSCRLFGRHYEWSKALREDRAPTRSTSRPSRDPLHDEASYICQSCGEEIVVLVDLGAGNRQEYTEDCPVCCRPHLLVLYIDQDGGVQIVARAE